MISLVLIILVPLFTAGVVAVLGNWPNLRESISLLAGATLFILNVLILPSVLAGNFPAVWVAEPIPGLPISLRAEPLGALFGLTASFLWLVTTVYSIGYLRAHNELHQSRFFAFFAVAIASTMGVAFAGCLFLSATPYPRSTV